VTASANLSVELPRWNACALATVPLLFRINDCYT